MSLMLKMVLNILILQKNLLGEWLMINLKVLNYIENFIKQKNYFNVMKNKILKKLSKMILICIAKFRKVCIDTNCLDEQWFLNYQDTLNILSIDPDRR